MKSSLSYALSYWEYDSFFRDIDFVVVGAGLVGLNAALRLRDRNPQARILVLERGPLPIGASTRNAGFACFGSMTELLQDLEEAPAGEVWGLVERRYRGLERLRENLGEDTIHYEPLGGFEVFGESETQSYEHCLDHLDAFNEKLAPLTGMSRTFEPADDKIPRLGLGKVNHLIRNNAEGQLHTGRMMQRLLQKVAQANITVLGGVSVEALTEDDRGVNLSTSAGWSVHARHVLIATNGFAARLMPGLEVKPARNQVLVTSEIPDLQLSGAFHYDRGYFYFRNVGNRILLGGGRQLDLVGEETDRLGTTPHIRSALTTLLNEVVLPGRKEVTIDRWWSGILGVGNGKTPILKKQGDHTVIAVRLGGMGVAIGSLLGEEAADLLMEC